MLCTYLEYLQPASQPASQPTVRRNTMRERDIHLLHTYIHSVSCSHVYERAAFIKHCLSVCLPSRPVQLIQSSLVSANPHTNDQSPTYLPSCRCPPARSSSSIAREPANVDTTSFELRLAEKICSRYVASSRAPTIYTLQYPSPPPQRTYRSDTQHASRSLRATKKPENRAASPLSPSICCGTGPGGLDAAARCYPRSCRHREPVTHRSAAAIRGPE
ncbi:hypothetical protein BZA05DRAFT_384490 [Tricharina praecox]|uniref:uncharacterized protein n=1 Tax=Tricharina praecox TaxID=43433 RepID=UPI00221FFEA8|nr:uncharacterized protein BZA05DRAFT_384490 [Tricharina praecox]KAI5857706.1 hypothetical protein BZA05DRAFT_384490 [Tricharina praecox]